MQSGCAKHGVSGCCGEFHICNVKDEWKKRSAGDIGKHLKQQGGKLAYGWSSAPSNVSADE